MLCCSQCEYTTKFPSYLRRHMLTHQETRAIVCGKCGSQFKTTSAYNLHVREKHGSNAHVCQTCGLEFTHRRAMERHILCHSDVMHYGCTLCGYKCRRKQDLDRHLRTMHSGKVRRKRHEEVLANFFQHIADNLHSRVYGTDAYFWRTQSCKDKFLHTNGMGLAFGRVC